MLGLKFKIRHPNGALSEMQVEGDNALIGSGAHCEIRLSVDQASLEHVAVSLVGSGPVVEARSFTPQPMLNDVPFQRSPIMEGAVIGIGETRIWVTAGELEAGAETTKKQEQKTSPTTMLLAAIVVPVAGYILLMDDGAATSDVMPDPPALWGAPVAACSEQSPEGALALARQKADIAHAKRQRRPFDIKEGVSAVPLFEEAAACYAVARKPKSAANYAAEAQRLRAQVAEDFRTHQVRLEHATTVQDWATAQREVRVLSLFVEGQRGEYVTYLSNLERKLRIMYGDEER